METESTSVVIDAVSKNSAFNNSEKNINREKHSDPEFFKTLNSILDEFTIDDYKSIFFLLMDRLDGVEEFLSIIKSDLVVLKNRIINMELSEKILIELLGTLQMYKALNLLQTCPHIFKFKEEFNEIQKIWKVLYALCEEMTDNDLESLRNYIPDYFQDQNLSAEEWFAVALKCSFIRKNDLSNLKNIYKNNPVCLNLINDFENPELECYQIKKPTNDSPCGIALILNFESFHRTEEIFIDNAQKRLAPREGSAVDVDSLKELWRTFGFETIVKKNLTKSETINELKSLALKDHAKYDAFICCVLSHGNPNVIYASDSQEIHISDIIKIIEKSCSLKFKPKLFFIQACQGTKVHVGDEDHIYNSGDAHQPLANYFSADTDIFAVIATINGYVSFRDPKEGSLFVQSLCKVILEYGHNNSISEVISRVTNDVSKRKVNLGPGNPKNAIQIVPTYTTLRKKLIFKKRDTGFSFPTLNC